MEDRNPGKKKRKSTCIQSYSWEISKLPIIFVKRLRLFIFVAEIVQTNNTLEIDLNKVGPAQFQSMPNIDYKNGLDLQNLVMQHNFKKKILQKYLVSLFKKGT